MFFLCESREVLETLLIFGLFCGRVRITTNALGEYINLEAHIEKYLNCCQAEMGAYAVKKKRRYLTYFLVWCKIPPNELTIDDVFRFFNDVCPGKTEEVQYRIKTDLKCFLRYLSETSDIKLPFTLIKAKHPAHKPTTAVTYDEFIIMRDWCWDQWTQRGNKTYLRWWAMINMLFYLGCRRNELRTIELTNVDLINKSVLFKVGKTGQYKVRRYFFNLDLYLDAYNPKKYLFDVCGNQIAEMIHRICCFTNIHKDISPHSFRAGLITYLSIQGWTIQDIAEYIGQTIEVTQGYINHNPQLLLSKADDTFRQKKTYRFEAGRVKASITINRK